MTRCKLHKAMIIGDISAVHHYWLVGGVRARKGKSNKTPQENTAEDGVQFLI